MAETTEPCFVLAYSTGICVEGIPKSEVSSYNGLLNAITTIQEFNKQYISHLCPFTEEANQADINTKITSEIGDEWVNDCKGKDGHTWFTVMYKIQKIDNSVAGVTTEYTDSELDSDSDTDINADADADADAPTGDNDSDMY